MAAASASYWAVSPSVDAAASAAAESAPAAVAAASAAAARDCARSAADDGVDAAVRLVGDTGDDAGDGSAAVGAAAAARAGVVTDGRPRECAAAADSDAGGGVRSDATAGRRGAVDAAPSEIVKSDESTPSPAAAARASASAERPNGTRGIAVTKESASCASAKDESSAAVSPFTDAAPAGTAASVSRAAGARDVAMTLFSVEARVDADPASSSRRLTRGDSSAFKDMVVVRAGA
jgi:hypothetical protein